MRASALSSFDMRFYTGLTLELGARMVVPKDKGRTGIPGKFTSS